MDSQVQKPDSGSELAKWSMQGLSTAAYVKAEPLLPAEHKAALAMHLAAALNAPGDDPADVADAESILRLVIWNNEGSVVESIARAAANNPNMPNSLAWALANDDEAVAMPILEGSASLSDTDLIAIVEAADNAAKMGAIARRSSVSAAVSRSLALHGNEDTAHILLKNVNADIPEDALANILDRHEQHKKILDSMVGRDALSAAIAERLLDKVSPELADDLVARHLAADQPSADLNLPRIDPNIMGYRDEASPEDLDGLISQMIAQKEITAELLVQKICQGYFEFFSAALAFTSKLSHNDVRERLRESPSKALPDLWKSASLSVDWLPVASAAVSAFIFAHKNYNKSDVLLFRRNISDRALANLTAEKRKISDQQMKLLRSL